MTGPRSALRPQDILIAMKLRILEDSDPKWTQARIAQSLGISPTEVAFAFERLKRHHLVSQDKRGVLVGALCEFLIHGLKYVFPAERGMLTRGVPTGFSHDVLKKQLRIPAEQALVWPDSEGTARGQAIEPLYKTVPAAAKRDPKLHELLSWVDAIRIGGARETALARNAIQRILLKELA